MLQKKLTKHSLSETNIDNFQYVSDKYIVNNLLNSSANEWSNKYVIIGVDFDGADDSPQIVHMIHRNTTVNDMLIKFGELYTLGIDFDLGKLYPIQWPVKRGTAMISPLIKWKHDHDFRTPKHKVDENNETEKHINTSNHQFSFYKGHVFNGQTIFPATGYLFLIWEFYASIKDRSMKNMKICFEDVRFHIASTIAKDGTFSFYLTIQKTGYFEISLRNTTLVTGRIFEVETCDIAYEDRVIDTNLPMLTKNDIYTEMTLRGYDHKDQFRGLQKMTGNMAFIEWTGNWVTFLDNILQFMILQHDSRNIYIPIGLGKVVIDAKGHMDQIKDLGKENAIPVEINYNIARSKNVEITSLYDKITIKRKTQNDPTLETYKFIPNESSLSLEESLIVNMQIILENISMVNVNILEIFDAKTSNLQPVAIYVKEILNNIIKVHANITIYSPRKLENINGVQITDKPPEEQSALICIGYNLLRYYESMQKALTYIIKEGYIMSFDKVVAPPNK
ncbi:PREDICTED: fatty acid synthase-like, partial [Nicrophorus vespilloides]|uniref:Fatty acid synthase-like n=1 Tax=Nicrophorus vespilloides TaxID=110193 RepID=A0ABM1MVN0_NICVS